MMTSAAARVALLTCCEDNNAMLANVAFVYSTGRSGNGDERSLMARMYAARH